MKTAQLKYQNGNFSNPQGDKIKDGPNVIVLAFGKKEILKKDFIFSKLKEIYPQSQIVLCSTSGEIFEEVVYQNTVSIAILELERTDIQAKMINIQDFPDSFDAGKFLFSKLDNKELAYILVISDGSIVNGSELVRGLEFHNKKIIPITGGLAGDGDEFNSTVVGLNDEPDMGNIVAVGFYGKSLKIGYGSYGGFEMFGPEKIVTRSVSNRLYEVDNKSALNLYKQYLGVYAKELPSSALLFPLNVRFADKEINIVRTILSIDNEDNCMVFAGDIPEGSYVRFMKSNFDSIIEGATLAANNAISDLNPRASQHPKLALLISCVGRKLVLGNRIDEENEAVREVFGKHTLLTGFYSYGEIAPLQNFSSCELNNQTMTITTFDEDLT